MTGGRTVDQSDLHAYADGQLPPDKTEAMSFHLAHHAGDMAAVSAWVAQNRALRDLFDPTLDEPLPRRLAVAWLDRRVAVERMGRPSGLAIVAAASLVLGVALGAGAAWLFLDQSSPPSSGQRSIPGMVDEAVSAHTVFAGDEVRPVELGAADAAVLEAWFARRLGAPVEIPDLSGSGFTLLGGRLVSGPDGASAVVLYRTPADAKLSIVVSRAPAQADSELAVRRSGSLLTAWWVRNGTGFAVTASLPEPVIVAVAQQVRRGQLTSSGSSAP